MLCFKPSSVAFLLSLLSFSTASSKDGFPKQLQPFFSLYCNDCHSEGADDGGLDLDLLGGDLSDAETLANWIRIADRVHQGEMPPEDNDQPTRRHRSTFSKILNRALTNAHAEQKGTVMRRLNRREYQNTINDLFGTHLDLASKLPEDGRSGEFDNVGEALSISLVHLQQYLDAIDLAMDSVIMKTTAKSEPITIQTHYAETREGKDHIGKKWKQLKDGAVVQFVSNSYPTGMLRTALAKVPGKYRIRVTGYTHQADTPLTFSIGSTTFHRGAEKPTYGYYMFSKKPQTIELEAHMEAGHMVDVAPWGLWNRDYWIGKKDINAYTGPGLAIEKVELIGPLVDEFPSHGHKFLFQDFQFQEIQPSNPVVKTKSWYVPQFELIAKNPKLAGEKTITRVANAAFRRPASLDAIARYVTLYQAELKNGASTKDAMGTAVSAIFCSPDFLYLQEPSGWLDDYAIASRLSYFLTRTMPDAELLEAAKSKRLSQDPHALLHHARRLMNTPHHQRFIIDFTDAWLNLRDINFTSPDTTLFPEYDAFLQYSMLEETRRYFAALIEDNASVTHVVKSDFAMLNNRLALHYGISDVEGPDFRRVSLPKSSVRGGLLSQASVLKVSANGTSTSPVVRGIWVMERIAGNKPPPPPPGISGVEPDVRGASTLRELLEKHRDSDTCNGCHSMIDPPGFALESFNPIGGWRERFRSLGEGEKSADLVNGIKVRYKTGPPVDATGTLSDGSKFKGFVDFRNRMAKSEDLLARALLTKLLTFATGREMGFSDRQSIAKLVERSKKKGHGVRDLIELTITSKMFRRK